MKASGSVIDGWQKIEGVFTYDETKDLTIQLNGGLWGTFFDDFRIHPFKSNLQSFIYDRYSGRLTTTLDENNYATHYLYDTEGISAQVKKETDQGIITVSENRQSLSKH